ncbi:MAG: membrane integrity-associated transporter subunit PqiC [Verrucomicrobia bacterium]|nr:membrane integrity-associated transporter subunit PqiC [Verrucomicrobiota bacterium]MBV8376492.1 membrane integrity-associated transporter subunit PqiC [Verrucomicrobiota bacterium]
MSFLASCATREPLPNFFLLTGSRPRAQSSGGTSVLVRRVQVPAYLARNNLVTIKGGMEVQYAPTDRWAESLDQGLARAVAEDLSRNSRIRAYGFSPGAPPVDHSYDVWIRLEHFEGNDNGEVVLSARWSVSSADSSEPIKRGAVDLRQSGWKPGDYPGLVHMLSDEVKKMSLQIAEAIP